MALFFIFLIFQQYHAICAVFVDGGPLSIYRFFGYLHLWMSVEYGHIFSLLSIWS